jgi:exocyst complex component 3
MAAPQVSAAQAIGEYLQSPDDLLKISAFRKKLEKEKASIDARLKSGVKEQLDATREGLTKLLGTRNNVQVIKEEMQIVDRMCSDPQNVVSTFDQISRVRYLSLTHSANLSLYRCLWCTGISNRRRRWSTIYWS